MGRPVIVDDGGSIRIRLLEDGPGEMNGLLTGTEHEIEQGQSYTNAFIGWVEEKPNFSGTSPIGQFKKILVSTDLGQNVEVTLDQGKLKIRVSGSKADPIIECKSRNKRLSYTVVNGGCINGIQYEDQNNNNHDFIFPGPTVYMGVVIT